MTLLLTARCPRFLKCCECEACMIWEQMRAPLSLEGPLGAMGLVAAIYAWRQSSLQRQLELAVLVTERDIFIEMAKVTEAEVEAIRTNVIRDLVPTR